MLNEEMAITEIFVKNGGENVDCIRAFFEICLWTTVELRIFGLNNPECVVIKISVTCEAFTDVCM